MRASAALPSPALVAEGALSWFRDVASFAERRRWWIIGLCILEQWLFLWHDALGVIHHNGWLFQDGDDGPWYWTTAWAMTSLHVPYTAVGPGWPYLLTPFAAIFGPNMANGLPAVIALNVLVLAPASAVGMYLLGERIAGRIFGVWTAVLWTLMPALAFSLYSPAHRTYLADFFLPTGTGLNTLSDYPSMVCAIFCAYLLLRAIDTNSLQDGALAGVMLGFLVLIKPANGPLPVVGVVALVATLRLRALAGTLVAAVPAAIALAVWKQVGTGGIPALSGGGGGGGGTSTVTQNAHKYLNIDFHRLGQDVRELREVFWSMRLLEFLLVAGVIALVARSRWKGLFVVGWFVAFGLIKGTVSYADVYDTSIYRFLLPAWPAWTLIVAGVAYCWPVGLPARARRRAADLLRARAVRPVGKRALIAVAVVFAALPVALVVAVSPAQPGAIVDENYTGAPIPVVDFGLRATQVGPHSIRFDWSSQATKRAKTAYAIFKGVDAGCGPPDPAQLLCRFRMQFIGTTHSTTFVDSQAVTRRFYRVGLVKGATVQVDNPSMLLMSKPIAITPR